MKKIKRLIAIISSLQLLSAFPAYQSFAEETTDIKSIIVIAILLLVLGTIITIGLTNLIQSAYSNNDIYSQVTFLYK